MEIVSTHLSGTTVLSQSEPGTLCIASCQFPVCADVSANAQWIQKQMKESKQEGAHIVHFPECALSGYAGVDFDSLDDLDWGALHRQTKAILSLADELDLWVLLGSTHRLSAGHKPHNSLYVIDPEGRIIDRYDKRFCTSDDLAYYSPGDHFVTFEVNGVKCGLLICYDIRFPELYRAYSTKDVQVIFQSFYNARQKQGSIHPIIMPVTAQARAATNYMFMSLTNSSAPCSWPCHFITPDGLIAGKLIEDEAGVLISTIDTSKRYYDASKPFRANAIHGKLNSGQRVVDVRSQDRKIY
ncbi:MAG: carbon-nitrogen hydrolase family protein [Gemmatimonadota bacterium]|nr:MAG: carbon-nitrogen hydrolase family protein [Gemmatimonadota bacterium]